MAKLQLTMATEQASAVSDALDAYTRLCIGQLEEVAQLVRQGVIPMAMPGPDGQRQTAPVEVSDRIEELMVEAKRMLGHPSNGSHGIGHAFNALAGRRAYEVKKVIDKTVAVFRNPNPGFRTVAYDGLGPRYTTDSAPAAVIIEDATADSFGTSPS